MTWFNRWRRRAPAPAPEPEKKGIRRDIPASLRPTVPRLELTPVNPTPAINSPFKPAEPPKGSDAPSMAQDSAFTDAFSELIGVEGVGFMGFAFLAELAQRPEYRRMSETLAKEMTREWIQIVSTGDESDGPSIASRAQELKKRFQEADPSDKEAQEEVRAQWQALLEEQADEKNPKAEKIKRLSEALKRLKVQDAFRRVAELDGFFGRGQIYLDTGRTNDAPELATPMVLSKRKVRKGSLKRLVVVEPMWSYPADYNASDPLRPDYYRPKAWYVMSKKVHATRLLTFIGRQMPDMLKPAYSFSGLSLSQMAKPYVDNWLRTRQSVSDLVASFVVWGLKTDLSSVLNGADAEQLATRADLFNSTRDNFGLMMLNKGMQEGDPGEEFFNVQASLAGLHELQAQSQEQMAAVAGVPIVKLLGITPSGLNASSDGEIRAFYDFIAAFQEQLFRDPLEFVFKAVQLSEFGEIDPEIGFEFEPLWQLDEAAEAQARKADADIDCGYVDRGILSPKEVRTKIAADKKSPYASIDVGDVPEEPEEEPGQEAGEGPFEDDDADAPGGEMPSGGRD